MRVDKETVRAYLTEMYLGVPGLLNVWSVPEKRSGAFFETTEEGIEHAVTFINAQWEAAGQQGIYSRITTMKGRPSDPDSRGTVADSQSFIGLWTDIDFGTAGHAAKGTLPLPPDAAAAQAVYTNSGLPEASLTVHSGGGLYHLVKLAEPYDITDTETRMRISALARRWQLKVKATAESMGYSYGAGVSDLARVLRIPGTVNAKEWSNKRRAAFMSSGARYTLEDLEEACPPPPKPTQRATSVDGGAPAGDARARMDQLLAEMRATREYRNDTLNRLACWTFQYAGAGQLDPDEVEREFVAAGLDSGLEEYETHRTVRSAREAGLARPLEWKNFTRTTSTAAPRTPTQPVDMWAGQLDDSGQVPDPATAPSPVAPKAEEPAVTPVASAAQEDPAEPDTVTVETETDPLLDASDPLVDTRMPRVGGTIRTSSDKKPYSVAQELRDGFFLHNGKPTLMRWQEMWVRWDGSCWNTMSNDDVSSWLYRRMDRAFYMNKVDGQWTEIPWNPTNSSIVGLDKALRAAVNLRDDTKQNTMIGEGVHDLAVSCANGLLRVTGRELAPADPSFFTFSSVPLDFDREAKCPEWEKWLAETFAHDPATVDMIQEWFGYIMSGSTDQQKALMIQGIERSGKSLIARILQRLAGESNCAGPTLNSLTEQFGLWPLIDKTLAVIGDARLSKKGNTETITERLLAMTGGDTITVDRKMQRPWQGAIPARVVLLSNELPNWSDSAGVLPTRFLVARTVKSYLGNEDTGLLERLSKELPGILNWALDGLDRLNANGKFTVNEATPEVVGAQRDRSSPQKGFLEEMCVVGEDMWVSKDRLREMWRFWNAQRGVQVADSRESFTMKLVTMAPTVKARDQKKRVDGKLTPVYRGIGLLADHPELAPKDENETETEERGPIQGTLPEVSQAPPAEPPAPAPQADNPPARPFPQQQHPNTYSTNGRSPSGGNQPHHQHTNAEEP